MFTLKIVTMLYMKKRRGLQEGLARIHRHSKKHGLNPFAMAKGIVEKERPGIKKWVKRHGFLPHENPMALAAQATLIHEGMVADKMRGGIPSYDGAENAVFYDEQLAENEQGYDDFDPSVLGAIFKAGDAAIEAVNAKRIKKGLKPILSGKAYTNFKKKVTDNIHIDGQNITYTLPVGKETNPDDASDLRVAMEAAKGSLISTAQKDWMKKNLPIIIVVLVAVVAIVLIKRKK